MRALGEKKRYMSENAYFCTTKKTARPMNRMLYTPPVTKNLLFINIIAFMACAVFGQRGTDLTELLSLHFIQAPDFRLWQLATYMFMHANLQHLFFNMLALWMFGRVMEQSWGARRYLLFYMACGIGAGVCQELWQYGQYFSMGLDQYDRVNMGGGYILEMGQYLNRWSTVGASGAVYGILLGFGMTYPEERILIFPVPFPVKAKWFVAFYAVIEVASAFFTNDNTAHFAHLGGMLVGYLIIRHWRRRARMAQGFTGWGNYRAPQPGLADRLRRMWRERRRQNPFTGYRKKDDAPRQENTPPANQEEIDRILEKVRRSGYSSLTEEEKRKLFDHNG